MVTRVYTASSSCSTTMKKHQQEVMQYLEAHNIDFEVVDITMSEEKRQWMYKNIPKSKWPEHGNPLPPQIYYGDTYCGDYNDFFEAKESNTVSSFLRIKSKSASRRFKHNIRATSPCHVLEEVMNILHKNEEEFVSEVTRTALLMNILCDRMKETSKRPLF